MSIVNEILEELWNSEYKYKGVRVNFFGIPHFKKYKKDVLYNTISRLKKKGLIEKELAGIVLSKNGKEYVKRKFDSLKQFDKPKDVSKNRTLLVMFDVPTEKKAHREWLRWHLKKFGYIMVQKSAWVGPYPLPKEFSDYVKEIKLDKCIKTFKLAKSYI
jgi:DNA-binding transcriptional regulator PaaX